MHESSHEIFVTSPGNFSMAGVDLHTGFLLHLVGTSLRCLGIFLDAQGLLSSCGKGLSCPVAFGTWHLSSPTRD